MTGSIFYLRGLFYRVEGGIWPGKGSELFLLNWGLPRYSSYSNWFTLLQNPAPLASLATSGTCRCRKDGLGLIGFRDHGFRGVGFRSLRVYSEVHARLGLGAHALGHV